MQEDKLQYDFVIVGAGPAGLSAAIRLAQIGGNISIAICEKASDIGMQQLSGAILQADSLTALCPNWHKSNFATTVTSEELLFLTKHNSYRLPIMKKMLNRGNFIIRLGDLCKFLAEEASKYNNIDIFPQTVVADFVLDQQDSVSGVITAATGLARDGSKTASYMPGIIIHAAQTIIADGAGSFLSRKIINKFNLAKSTCTYGLGVKEIWQIPVEQHQLGKVIHTIGFPCADEVYGGGFCYHMPQNRVAVGFITALDYQNVSINPHEQMQQFKTHPDLQKVLNRGKRVAYGARVINEGGYTAIPQLCFPGGVLIGCSASLVDNAKLKGIHNAITSGMLAATELIKHQQHEYSNKPCYNFDRVLRQSRVGKDLQEARNIRPAFRYGILLGLVNGALSSLLRGKELWTYKNNNDEISSNSYNKDIKYNTANNKLCFDKNSSVYLTNNYTNPQQPCHITFDESKLSQMEKVAATNFCPANVYSIDKDKLHVNAENCIHCQTCAIKIVNLKWRPPQAGDGPNYQEI